MFKPIKRNLDIDYKTLKKMFGHTNIPIYHNSRTTNRLINARPADPGLHSAHPLGPGVLRREAHSDDDAEQRTAHHPRRLGADAPSGGPEGQRSATAVRGL